jgi:hypothetical protein
MIAPRVAAPSSSPFQPTPTPPIALRSAPRIKPAPRVRNKSPQNHSGTHQDVPFRGETLYAWRTEIALMWRFTRNNGITEGFHTKMELISRQAYGFRNFQNYRMRVKVLCGRSA